MTSPVVGLELDAQLWKDLPEELLESVITKLPFSRLVAFRTVCKLWYEDIIPRAASLVQASNKSALLYFGYHVELLRGRAWWFQVGNTQSDENFSIKEFQPDSFPLAEKQEDVRLMHSKGGLLFFLLNRRQAVTVREIVVCNPLTDQSKTLALPCPLRSWHHFIGHLLVGVVFDANGENYHLVVGGVNETDEFMTLVYSSSTGTWTKGPSLVPLFPAGVYILPGRSVCCNGNLYWCIETYLQGQQRPYVVKFDIQDGIWRVFPYVFVACSGPLGGWQITSCEGEILLWHLHIPRHDETGEFSAGELFDPEYVRYPQRRDRPCRHDFRLELGPEIRLMEHYMIDRIDGFANLQYKVYLDGLEYFAFGQQNLTFHVFTLFNFDGFVDELKIVVHDPKENSYAKLCTLLSRQNFKKFNTVQRFSPLNVWAFSPSLTAVP